LVWEKPNEINKTAQRHYVIARRSHHSVADVEIFRFPPGLVNFLLVGGYHRRAADYRRDRLWALTGWGWF
jgi:hypothetical protein